MKKKAVLKDSLDSFHAGAVADARVGAVSNVKGRIPKVM